MLWSLAIFVVATLGCIFAPNATIFLAFRMAQAIVVSAMVLSRAVVRDMLGPAEAASMIGYVTMGMAIAPMLAPAVGGALEGSFGWQGSFWLLLIAGLGMYWLTWRDLGETAVRHTSSLAEQIGTYPELLAARRFWGYAMTAAFASGAFFAYLGGGPYVGTEVYGLSPAVLGICLGAPAVGYAVGNGLSGRYSVRIGINTMVLAGASLSTVSVLVTLVLFLTGQGSALAFFGIMTFVGLGNGLVLPNATAGMLSVRPHLAGSASGLGGAIMIGGGAGLSALAGWVLELGTGATPLVWIMFLTSAAAVLTAIYTMARERRVSG
jgi:DHA1 family bicyclomycin/chloramphenicol resistance-like MFS transporter